MAKIPIACTLTDVQARDQVAEWQALHSSVLERDEIDGGVALSFPAALHDTVADLARREATCCAFLSLTVTASGDRVQLAITSDQADARPVIDALAGIAPI